MNKIVRLKSGALLGEAGDNDSRAVVKLLQGVKSFAGMPMALELADCRLDYSGIILFLDGTMAQINIELLGQEGPHFKADAFPVNRGCTAVGSGALIAIGAMRSGKSAREAVAIACEVDPNSKLPVHSYSIEIKRRKRAKT